MHDHSDMSLMNLIIVRFAFQIYGSFESFEPNANQGANVEYLSDLVRVFFRIIVQMICYLRQSASLRLLNPMKMGNEELCAEAVSWNVGTIAVELPG